MKRLRIKEKMKTYKTVEKLKTEMKISNLQNYKEDEII